MQFTQKKQPETSPDCPNINKDVLKKYYFLPGALPIRSMNSSSLGVMMI